MKRIAAFLLAASASFANAQFMSAYELFTTLKSPAPNTRTFAVGYIAGIVDSRINRTACVPDGTSSGEIATLVYETLQQVSRLDEIPADAFVAGVITKAWPCVKEPVEKQRYEPRNKKSL